MRALPLNAFCLERIQDFDLGGVNRGPKGQKLEWGSWGASNQPPLRQLGDLGTGERCKLPQRPPNGFTIFLALMSHDALS